MRLLGGGADIDGGNVGVSNDVLVIEGCRRRAGELLHFGQAVGPDSQTCSLLTRADRDRVSDRIPPHHPVPITATSTAILPISLGSCKPCGGAAAMARGCAPALAQHRANPSKLPRRLDLLARWPSQCHKWHQCSPGPGDAVRTNDPTKGLRPMRRLMLLVVAGVLGLVALLPHAQGQGQPGGNRQGQAAGPRHHAHPAGRREPGRGRTDRCAGTCQSGSRVRAATRAWTWTCDGRRRGPRRLHWARRWAATWRCPWRGLIATNPTSSPSRGGVVRRRRFLGSAAADVVALFTPADSAFKFDTDQAILGKTICLVQDHECSLNGNGRSWVSLKQVTVLRRATLLLRSTPPRGPHSHSDLHD